MAEKHIVGLLLCGHTIVSLFEIQAAGRTDLWVLPERKSILGKAPSPIRLTNSLISYNTSRLSPDGKKLFAAREKLRGELTRYDVKSRQFVAYLSGKSAVAPRVSPDRNWIIYVSYPDHTLWRSNADGSGQAQLTYPPIMVYYAEIFS